MTTHVLHDASMRVVAHGLPADLTPHALTLTDPHTQLAVTLPDGIPPGAVVGGYVDADGLWRPEAETAAERTLRARRHTVAVHLTGLQDVPGVWIRFAPARATMLERYVSTTARASAVDSNLLNDEIYSGKILKAASADLFKFYWYHQAAAWSAVLVSADEDRLFVRAPDGTLEAATVQDTVLTESYERSQVPVDDSVNPYIWIAQHA